jgi:hypothetical protein
MVLNRGGALTKDYFVAYLKLIMNTKECPIAEAKEIAFHRLFRGNRDTLGLESYERFLLAFDSLAN